MLVVEYVEKRSCPQQACRELITKIMQTEPGRESRTLAWRQQLAQVYVRPGVYKRGNEPQVWIHGPVCLQGEFDVEKAYYACARVQEGADKGKLLQLPLFGADGFFEAYRKLD